MIDMDRTELRLKLYANGFTPIPNKNKACYLKGWSTIDVNPEVIKSKPWARSRAWPDTGVRCGDIVAIDWDVNDADLLNGLLDAVVEKGLVPESTFVRIGKPPRELWVYRTSDKIGKRTTGAFIDGDKEEEKVEFLGAGCQFAGYGMRDENTEYQWPADNILDHEYMDLPEINLQQVEAVKDFAIAFFEEKGLSRASPMAGTDGGYTHVYDLVPDDTFTVKDMGNMTVAEMGTYLNSSKNDEVLRCTAETFRPTSGSWACMVSLSGGVLCISDHGTYEAHFPKSLLSTDKFSRLGQLMSPYIEAREKAEVATPVVAEDDLDMDPVDPFDVNLEKALKRFIYIQQDDTILDGYLNLGPYSPKHFRTLMAPYYEIKEGPRGGEIMTSLCDLWTRAPNRLDAVMASMRPDMPSPLYSEKGVQFANTYRRCELPTDGNASVGMDFLRRLLPIEEELQWFLQWLGHKILYPHVRGPGVIMVAHDTFGTGRGTLIDMLSLMFGEQYVRRIDFTTLTGSSYQSQYNEWLTGSLIVAVDEAQEAAGGASKWQARNNAYEHLKGIIDPGGHRVEVKRKGVSNYQGTTFASILVATNHLDAIVVPQKDRRLSILTNGESQPDSYWESVRNWMEKDSNMGAFREELARVDMHGFSAFDAPPMTKAKADMIFAGQSELDRAIGFVFESLEGDVVVKEQIILGIERYLEKDSADMPDNWKNSANYAFMSRTSSVPGYTKVMYEGKNRVVRALPGTTATVYKSEQVLLDELIKNGPVARQLETTGRVVSFNRGTSKRKTQ